MIYTSYFGNIKKILAAFPDAGLVSIAGKTPEWFNGKKYLALAPKYSWWKEWYGMFASCLDGEESKSWYTDKYYKTVLDALDPTITARELKDLASWKPTFILCYETSARFCHRHIVANWLSSYRIECEEWTNEDKK